VRVGWPGGRLDAPEAMKTPSPPTTRSPRSVPSLRIGLDATFKPVELHDYPNLRRLVEAQISCWPDHAKFLSKSIAARTPEEMLDSETYAQVVLRIAEKHETPLAEICADYQYFCQEMILEAELYFRRHKKYKLSRFEDAYREVYSKPDIMKRYMNGLLLSGVFWVNHAKALSFYVRTYLAGNVQGYSHLEVGPGHGSLLYFAAIDPRAGRLTGWDVSPGAIEATGRTLATVGVEGRVDLACQDVFEAAKGDYAFDSIVVSEVLEHLEEPLRALENLYLCLKPGGRILVNMPANSPSPDHIFLIEEPEETTDLMKAAGLEVVDYRLFPMTGYTLEQCRKHKLTINCSAIGMRPA
jgi:2-polyprenyl-3-methyl-5-hydroxy-6-metoxy-1,4-benzoquinol methylase